MSGKTDPQAVLDASALLAYLGQEPGRERVAQALREGAIISAVNLSETYTKLVSWGVTTLQPIAVRLAALGLSSVPFDEDLAQSAAELSPYTQPHGLSLGDRAALALTLRESLPVLTTDQAWADLAVPALHVVLIR